MDWNELPTGLWGWQNQGLIPCYFFLIAHWNKYTSVGEGVFSGFSGSATPPTFQPFVWLKQMENSAKFWLKTECEMKNDHFYQVRWSWIAESFAFGGAFQICFFQHLLYVWRNHCCWSLLLETQICMKFRNCNTNFKEVWKCIPGMNIIFILNIQRHHLNTKFVNAQRHPSRLQHCSSSQY